jgi:hypothetical protein
MKSSTEVTEGAMIGAAATSITIAQAVTTTSGVLLVVATGVSRPVLNGLSNLDVVVGPDRELLRLRFVSMAGSLSH